MIQAITETQLTVKIQTEDNRIDTSVASEQIRHLFKFINDLDKSVIYNYASSEKISERYTTFVFTYTGTHNVYNGNIKFLPAGHWKYEVYEVSWVGTVVVASGTAPATETDILPKLTTNGVVKGIVTKGILNLTEKAGTEQVQYTQHETTEGTNTIYYGQ
tara:strand:- start:27 stop:506 length:480 start_codon:yes stop_codon:yes gene_type:complete